MLAGSTGSGQGDFRNTCYPRFQGDNLKHNEMLANALAKASESEGITAAQAAIAWVASQGNDIIPLVGARKVDRLTEALGAPLRLSADVLSAIEKTPFRKVRLMAGVIWQWANDSHQQLSANAS